MTPLDAAKALAVGDMPCDSKDFRFCAYCPDYYEGEEYPPHQPSRHIVKDHAQDCPILMLPQIVAALEAGSTCAGLLLMVLNNEVRNGWVQEESDELKIPREALDRWYTLNPLPPTTT